MKECKPAWYAIIVDEATDVANKEQLNLSIRWVNNEYGTREDPVWLYCLPNTKADTLYEVVTDIVVFHFLCVEGKHWTEHQICKDKEMVLLHR